MSSDPQPQILAYIRAHPHCSYREIVAGCGLSSTSVAKYHVRQLVAAGLVTWTPTIARSLRCSDPLRDAARQLVDGAERRGGVAVVAWAAVERISEALE